MNKQHAVLLISCMDRRGIVAAVSSFLYQHGANIIHADQHTDKELGLFFMRVEWEMEGFDIAPGDIIHEFDQTAGEFAMNYRLALLDKLPRLAIIVSKDEHCLIDLLARRQSGELQCEIPLIISNHPNARRLADFYNVPFYQVDAQDKAAAEEKALALLNEHSIDLVVLARYMQILSPNFTDRYPNRIINIHHSFLPAFVGARPYNQAYYRGIKIIGATSHYVTPDLDQGPIIEQDVIRISHRDTIADLIQKGRDLEKVVLSRAARWHLGNRVLVYGNKTVVFD